MQKGDISGRYNGLRNRGEGNDAGIYWVSRRLGRIRNVIIFAGFGFCMVYGYYWFKKHGDKLKNPCQKAYEQPINGTVLSVFLDSNSRGIVTVRVAQQGGDTLEYYTGRGGHKNAGSHLQPGYLLKKQPNTFDLEIVKTDSNTTIMLSAPLKNCDSR